MLKIMLIVGLNIMALVVACGCGPDHHAYGFQYWRNPGPFVQYLGIDGSLGRFLGFWTVFSNAVYAYSGVGYIAVAAAETESPRRNVPTAAKRIFWRVGLFYALSMFMVGLIVPSNDENLLQTSGTAAQSPFVIAATRAGIKIVPLIINAVVLNSAWSSGNSGLLSGSRVLYGLAQEGRAPRILKRTNRLGIPWVAVLSMGVFLGLGYMTSGNTASTVVGDLCTAPLYNDYADVETVVHLAARSSVRVRSRQLDHHLHCLPAFLLRHEEAEYQQRPTVMEGARSAIHCLVGSYLLYRAAFDWRIYDFYAWPVSIMRCNDMCYVC